MLITQETRVYQNENGSFHDIGCKLLSAVDVRTYSDDENWTEVNQLV